MWKWHHFAKLFGQTPVLQEQVYEATVLRGGGEGGGWELALKPIGILKNAFSNWRILIHSLMVERERDSFPKFLVGTLIALIKL